MKIEFDLEQYILNNLLLFVLILKPDIFLINVKLFLEENIYPF